MASGRPYLLRDVRSRRHARATRATGTRLRPRRPAENGMHPRHRRLAVSRRSSHRYRPGNTVGRRRGGDPRPGSTPSRATP